jgi:hypothetical protein
VLENKGEMGEVAVRHPEVAGARGREKPQKAQKAQKGGGPVGEPLGLAADSVEDRRWLWLFLRRCPDVDTELQDSGSSRGNPFRRLETRAALARYVSKSFIIRKPLGSSTTVPSSLCHASSRATSPGLLALRRMSRNNRNEAHGKSGEARHGGLRTARLA